jgi:hypothetical protein
MLPTPEELRERSLQFRAAARKAGDNETKRRLATDAFILAQLAEAIAREGVVGPKTQKYERLLADILGEDAVRAPTAVQKVGADHSRSWTCRASVAAPQVANRPEPVGSWCGTDVGLRWP